MDITFYMVLGLLVGIFGAVSDAQCLSDCLCFREPDIDPNATYGFTLDCRGRGLDSIPSRVSPSLPYEGAVQPLIPDDEIKDISFAYNHIKILSDNNLANFTKINNNLDISHNRITDIEDNAFADFSDTFTSLNVDLSYNKMVFINFDIFKYIPSLSSLILSHNNIINILSSQKINIYTLKLDHNDIDHFPPGFFEDMVGLYDVDLSFNRLLQVPDLSALHLGNLNLEHNSIWEVDSLRLGNLSMMFFLNLDNNQLTSINHATAKLFDDFAYFGFFLTLYDNPWRCDCGLSEILDVWPTHPFIIEHTFVCQTPSKFKGRDFWSLKQSEMCEEDDDDEDDDDDDSGAKNDTKMTRILVVTIVGSILTTLAIIIAIAAIISCCWSRKRNKPARDVTGNDNAIAIS
ncbi:keratocan-like [Glandiceps talaboti]